MGQSAMHATYYKSVKEGDDCKKIMLTVAQYKRLVTFVDDKFDKDQQGSYIFIPTNAVYGNDDAFMMPEGAITFCILAIHGLIMD